MRKRGIIRSNAVTAAPAQIIGPSEQRTALLFSPPVTARQRYTPSSAVLLACLGLAAVGCGDNVPDAGPDAAPLAPCTDDPCTADGCLPVLLARFDPSSQGHLAAGDGHVCISFMRVDGVAITEYRCFDRCGGAVLATGNSAGYAVGMALDGDDLTAAVSVAFPNGYAKVSRLSLATNTSSPLWSTEGWFDFQNLLRRGDSLYFSSDGDTPARQGIFRMPYRGGAPVRISEWLVAAIRYGMVRLDDVLYFSSATPEHYGLHSMPIDGGSPTLLYRPVSLITSVAARDGRVFWAELGEDGLGGLVKTSAVDGSDLRTLATLPDHVRDLAVDDDTVYVVTSAAVMSIRAVPVAGGEVTVPLPASPRVDLLTVDADYLFFVGNFGVYRLRKRGP